jgi:hypothetical protein
MNRIYVTIELAQGNIAAVHAYLNERQALTAEQRWLKDHTITDELDREGKAQNGNEFHTYPCILR